MSYAIYVSDSVPNGTGWTVRVFRDDDKHIHSAERAPLGLGLRECERAIVQDITNVRDAATAEVLTDEGERKCLTTR